MGIFHTLAHLYHPRRSNNHRARVLHPEVLGIFSLIVFGVFTTVYASMQLPGRLGSVLGYASNISASDVISQTNQQRQTSGLGALAQSDRLSAAATAKAQDMFSKQYWAHTSPAGDQPWKFIKDAGYSYKVAGENLARDFSITNEMVDAWMASPTHRANIMNSSYSEIGIAVVNGALEGVETTLVVQMFGSPRIAVAQVPKATARPAATVSPVADQFIAVVSPQPQVIPELVTVEQRPNPVELAQENTELLAVDAPNNQVLASAVFPEGSLTVPPLFSPLQILKAVFLALIMMLVFTLIYDSLIIGNRQVLRLVGHNLSHVLLLSIVAYLIISFKAGVLG